MDEADIIFSDSAAKKVGELIIEEKDENLKLRVYITGGGCSGFSYGFVFDKDYKDGDSAVDNSGVRLVVDPMSYQYLIGATVDYLEDLQGLASLPDNQR